MEQTTINERIFIEIEIGMRECKVMATGSKIGRSADVYVAVEEGNVGFAG